MYPLLFHDCNFFVIVLTIKVCWRAGCIVLLCFFLCLGDIGKKKGGLVQESVPVCVHIHKARLVEIDFAVLELQGHDMAAVFGGKRP